MSDSALQKLNLTNEIPAMSRARKTMPWHPILLKSKHIFSHTPVDIPFRRVQFNAANPTAPQLLSLSIAIGVRQNSRYLKFECGILSVPLFFIDPYRSPLFWEV